MHSLSKEADPNLLPPSPPHVHQYRRSSPLWLLAQLLVFFDDAMRRMVGVPTRPISDAAITGTRMTLIQLSPRLRLFRRFGRNMRREPCAKLAWESGRRPQQASDEFGGSLYQVVRRLTVWDRSGGIFVIRSAGHWEARLRPILALLAIAFAAGGCTTTAHEAAEMFCSDYIGKPISSRIAAYGPPTSVYRINSSQVGYVFKTRNTAYVGGEPYYTVNYLTGADKHRTPVRKITRICHGVYVVHAPSDAMPVSERVIVKVLP
jgi:hypothetical protein